MNLKNLRKYKLKDGFLFFKNTPVKFFSSFIILFSAFVTLQSFVPTKELEEITTENISIKNNINNISINDKILIKTVEKVTFYSKSGNKTVKARIDTGATQSSIDSTLARQLGYNKYIGNVIVVSANGSKTRPLVEVNYELSGKIIKSIFTISDRKNLNFPVLIGRSDLNGFLIDPSE